jgi:tRNA threonylcarbamoyladenosine biosynthesis protein TsaE
MTHPETFEVQDHAAMVALGTALARRLGVGDVVLLHGDLGAGKTTLTQGLAAGLGIQEAIQSPTFTLVAEHAGTADDGTPVRLYHLDLYRLGDPEELESVGYGQYLAPEDGVAVIEWPERAGSWLPARFWLARIEMAPAGGRTVTLTRHGGA